MFDDILAEPIIQWSNLCAYVKIAERLDAYINYLMIITLLLGLEYRKVIKQHVQEVNVA